MSTAVRCVCNSPGVFKYQGTIYEQEVKREQEDQELQ